MKLLDFCEKYEMTRFTVLQHKRSHLESAEGFYILPCTARDVGVKERFFIEKKNEQKAYIKKNHDIYFAILEYVNVNQLCLMLEAVSDCGYGAWNTWVNYNLFAGLSKNITNYKINSKQVQFRIASEKILKELENING